MTALAIIDPETGEILATFERPTNAAQRKDILSAMRKLNAFNWSREISDFLGLPYPYQLVPDHEPETDQSRTICDSARRSGKHVQRVANRERSTGRPPFGKQICRHSDPAAPPVRCRSMRTCENRGQSQCSF